jgi:hypothetical protein
MSITYFVRFIGGDPVAIYRIVHDEKQLKTQILRREGWDSFPDAIRYYVGGNIDASEATADQAKRIANQMGLPFPDQPA